MEECKPFSLLGEHDELYEILFHTLARLDFRKIVSLDGSIYYMALVVLLLLMLHLVLIIYLNILIIWV